MRDGRKPESELARASRRLSQAIARSQTVASYRRGSRDVQQAKIPSPNARSSTASKSYGWGGESASRLSQLPDGIPLSSIMASNSRVGESSLEQHKRQEINRSLGRVDARETPREFSGGVSAFGTPFDWQARASQIHSTWRTSPRQTRRLDGERYDGFLRFKNELWEAAKSFRARNPVESWQDPFEWKRSLQIKSETSSGTNQQRKESNGHHRQQTSEMVFGPVGQDMSGYVEHTIFIPAGGWKDITFVPDVPDGTELIPCSIYLPSAVGNGLSISERSSRNSYSSGGDGSIVRRRPVVIRDASEESSVQDGQTGSYSKPEGGGRMIMSSGATVFIDLGDGYRELGQPGDGRLRMVDELPLVEEDYPSDVATGNVSISINRVNDDTSPNGRKAEWHELRVGGGEVADDYVGSGLLPDSEYVSVMGSPYTKSLDGHWILDDSIAVSSSNKDLEEEEEEEEIVGARATYDNDDNVT
ncbi:hypothetical protein FOL47_010002 [Perkinsus chesapeaki]|uniref:Uncharacterized protein n=1 Tax=Perkinsus chesapeaki TaxID=330153 RepID=A0A7J6MQS0_PERCH|nr:hypothetical protein FOL47_010002 [Perkinsus chesapeaki]